MSRNNKQYQNLLSVYLIEVKAFFAVIAATSWYSLLSERLIHLFTIADVSFIVAHPCPICINMMCRRSIFMPAVSVNLRQDRSICALGLTWKLEMGHKEQA